MKRLILASLVMAAVGGSALHAQPAPQAKAQEGQITPGLWEYRTRVFGFIPAGKELKCLSGSEIDKFFDNLCNRHHTCTYPKREVGNGRIALEGTWTNKEGKRTAVKAQGTYTPNQVSLKANAMNLSATLEGKWVAASCTPGVQAKK